MKRYKTYMDQICVDAALRARLVQGMETKQRPAAVRRGLAAAAASLALLGGLGTYKALAPEQAALPPEPKPVPEVDVTARPIPDKHPPIYYIDNLLYVQAQGFAADGALAAGSFSEELDGTTRAALLPDELEQKEGTGYAWFSREGDLYVVALQVEEVSVVMSNNGMLGRDWVYLGEEAVFSVVQGITIKAFQYRDYYEAVYQKDGISFRLFAEGEAAREKMEEMLALFIVQEAPDLSRIVPKK